MNRIGAFLLAPVPAAILGGIAAGASDAYARPEAVVFLYLLLLYAFQLLFGLPLAALLLRAGKANALAFSLAGALMVAIPAVPYMIWSLDRHPDLSSLAPTVLALWLFMGALNGLAFWFLGAARRPPPPPPDEKELHGTFS